jgi:putative membrane protein
MEDYINLKYVVSAIIFSAIGLAVFVGGFVVLDLLTPRVNIWKELVEKQNTAVALLIGACVIGIAMIISSAIHG